MIKIFNALHHWFAKSAVPNQEKITVVIKCADRRAADTIYRALVLETPHSEFAGEWPYFNGPRAEGTMCGVKFAIEFDRRRP